MAGIHRQCWRQTFMLIVVLFTALGNNDMATASRAEVPERLRRVQKTGNALIRGHEHAMSNSFQHTRTRPDPSIRQNPRDAILDNTNDRIARPLEIAVADEDTSNAGIDEEEQSQIETLRQNDPAFDKCYAMLQDVSEDQVRVTPDEYVEFLNNITNGEIPPTADLNAIDEKYATPWYNSTCPSGRPCAQENAYISLDPEEQYELNSLISLCGSVMSLSLTTVTVTFEFTIRYNSDLISMEDVSQCLEIAAENLVLDSFGCDFEGNGNATRGIQNNAPIRKLEPSPTLAREGISVSFRSSSSSSSSTQPLVSSGRPVDYWQDEDEKIILALLLNEGQDSRFLDAHMSMQPTPPPAKTLQPTKPPTGPPPRSPSPTGPPRSPPPTVSPQSPAPTLSPKSPAPTLSPTLPALPPTVPPTLPPAPRPTPSTSPPKTLPPTPQSTPSPSAAPALTFPPSDCPFYVEAAVDSIVEFPCEGLQQDITCGIVRMTIIVTAPQSIMPSEDELRAQVIATLREAINGDGFEAYFPPGCSVTG